MKNLTIIGVFLVLSSAIISNTTGVPQGWIMQSGIIFLFGALSVFSNKKRVMAVHSSLWKIIEITSLWVMLSMFVWGFLAEMWFMHPLGAIISFAGCGQVIYRGIKKNN